jgi:hypothetical protein
MKALTAVIVLALGGCVDDTPLDESADCESHRQRLADMQECFEHRGCVVEEYHYSWIKRQVRRCEIVK